jgi:hypothetical protein
MAQYKIYWHKRIDQKRPSSLRFEKDKRLTIAKNADSAEDAKRQFNFFHSNSRVIDKIIKIKEQK